MGKGLTWESLPSAEYSPVSLLDSSGGSVTHSVTQIALVKHTGSQIKQKHGYGKGTSIGKSSWSNLNYLYTCKLSMVVYTYNASSGEAKTGRSLGWLVSQPGLAGESPSQSESLFEK